MKLYSKKQEKDYKEHKKQGQEQVKRLELRKQNEEKMKKLNMKRWRYQWALNDYWYWSRRLYEDMLADLVYRTNLSCRQKTDDLKYR
eukprot:UN07267